MWTSLTCLHVVCCKGFVRRQFRNIWWVFSYELVGSGSPVNVKSPEPSNVLRWRCFLVLGASFVKKYHRGVNLWFLPSLVLTDIHSSTSLWIVHLRVNDEEMSAIWSRRSVHIVFIVISPIKVISCRFHGNLFIDIILSISTGQSLIH